MSTLTDKIKDFGRDIKYLASTKQGIALFGSLVILTLGGLALRVYNHNSELRFQEEAQRIEQEDREYWKQRSPNTKGLEPTSEELKQMQEEIKKIEIEIDIRAHPEKYFIFELEPVQEKSPENPQPEPKKQKHDSRSKGLEKTLVYSTKVESLVEYYNNKFNFPTPLTPERIYAHIATESLGHDKAFKKDPMQVATITNPAFKTLVMGREFTRSIKDFSYLRGVKPVRMKNSRKDYTNTEINADISLELGTAWLIHKAAVRNYNGEIIGWRNWDSATSRYNGGGDPVYTQKVLAKEQKFKYLNGIAKN